MSLVAIICSLFILRGCLISALVYVFNAIVKLFFIDIDVIISVFSYGFAEFIGFTQVSLIIIH